MEILNELLPSKSVLLEYSEPGSHPMKDSFWHSGFLPAMESQMVHTGALTQSNSSHVSIAHELLVVNERPLAFSHNALSSCNSSASKLSTMGWVLSTADLSNGVLAGSYTSSSEVTNDHMQSLCGELVPMHHQETSLSRTPSMLALSDGSPSSDVMGSTEGSQLDHLMEFMFEEDDPMGGAFGPLDAWLPEAMEFPFVHPAPLENVAYTSPAANSSDGSTDEGVVVEDKKEAITSFSAHSPGQLGSVRPLPSMQDVGSCENPKKPNGLEEMFLPPKRPDEGVGRLKGVVTSIGSSRSFFQGAPDVGPVSEKAWQGSFSIQNGFSVDASALSVTSKSPYHGEQGILQNGAFGATTILNHSSKDSIKKSHDKIASQTPGPISFNGVVQVHQDITKEFGLNPILGSPLGMARSETDYSEICLVHLLIAGAEAVANRDMDLASVILVRLKELVSNSGSTMQRVAAYFSDGLQSRVEGKHVLDRVRYGKSHSDILAAFQILHEISPYIKFGHFTANQAILEAVEGEKCVHIVDFEIMEGIQWPPLMQALALRKGGPSQLRITALFRPHVERGLAMVQETGKRLTDFALSLNLPFSFHMVKVNNEEEFSVSSIKLIRGEALVVNCMLHLPHMPQCTAMSVSSFLHGMRRLSPILLTVVEEELGCSTMAVASYFFKALHHFSSICDSLEACLSNETVAHMLVERVFLAPRINSTVMFWSGSSAQSELGADHATYNWCSLIRQVGFKSLPLSFQNLSQARLLLGLYKDGFKLEEQSNRLLLGWRSKPLFAASVWN